MPIDTRVVLAAFGLALTFGQASAQAPVADVPTSQLAHHAAKPKLRAGAPAVEKPGMHVDDWFSYGAPKEADVEREAPGVKIKAEDPQGDEDLVVYGQRLKRDFEDTRPGSDLTSPQALDAAQPMVPGIGDSCSYKSGCFDNSQVPLRSALSNVLGGD